MGLLNSALHIGRSALLGYEAALHVVGQNVAAAGSPDHTRLVPQLDPIQGGVLPGELHPGAGVALSAIQRNIDEALEARHRLAIGTESAAATRQSVLAQIEALFDNLSGTGVGTRLTEFFHSWDEVQNTPEDPAIRDLTITRGVLLAESFRSLRAQLVAVTEDVNEQITYAVQEADALAHQIAQLNGEIVRAEAGGSAQATALRDQRDGLLRALSALVDVTVREQPDGTINVYIGSEALIQGSSVRGLVAVQEPQDRTLRTSVRFADTNQQVQIRGGRLAGLLAARDQVAPIATLDQLAAALIVDVNRLHADGQGLVGYTSLTSANDLLATDVPLDSSGTGLPVAPQDGSFYITMIDGVSRTPTTYRIDVNLDGSAAGASLQTLVSEINAEVAGLTASVTSDNRLHLEADQGLTFTFGFDGQVARPDTSGILAALGINTFFTGTDARDIAVQEQLVQQPNLLSAASVFLAGDGSVAAQVASLATAPTDVLAGSSFTDFFNTMISGVAIDGAAAREDADAAASVLASLQAQRESISGVNLDEEAIALLKYERAFQGAARFVSVVDQLLSELVSLIR